jgi:hypothetical protein
MSARAAWVRRAPDQGRDRLQPADVTQPGVPPSRVRNDRIGRSGAICRQANSTGAIGRARRRLSVLRRCVTEENSKALLWTGVFSSHPREPARGRRRVRRRPGGGVRAAAVARRFPKPRQALESPKPRSPQSFRRRSGVGSGADPRDSCMSPLSGTGNIPLLPSARDEATLSQTKARPQRMGGAQLQLPALRGNREGHPDAQHASRRLHTRARGLEASRRARRSPSAGRLTNPIQHQTAPAAVLRSEVTIRGRGR